MSVIIGILSFSKLRTFLTDIQGVDVRPFSQVDDNAPLPVLFYKLENGKELLIDIGGKQLVQVIYVANWVDTWMTILFRELEKIKDFVLVIKERVPVNEDMSAIIPRFSGTLSTLKSTQKTLDEWYKLDKEQLSLDNTTRDARLESLIDHVRHSLLEGRSATAINTDILSLLEEDTRYLKSVVTSRNTLRDLVNETDETQVLSMDEMIKRSRPTIPAPDVSFLSNNENIVPVVLPTLLEIPDPTMNELTLSRLNDNVSVFIRTAIGAIGMDVTEAFISMPDTHGITRSKASFERYYSTLKPTVSTAMRRVDDWIRPSSKNRTNLPEIVLDTSLTSNARSLFTSCAVFTGHMIIEAMNNRPTRGLQTRFTIPNTMADMNDIMDELELLLDAKYGPSGGRFGGRLPETQPNVIIPRQRIHYI